ncbi:hypothetical protein ACJ72_00122 [Emergomyces africanus]|uniref:Uncharacterized protein n=1 Tax=Emergomyces africanus TaxID=1955775 RepID=A0A1B7P8X6_9EURO|nr:hypothetical protein ACJ72_00122 [Emergomyces africanus]
MSYLQVANPLRSTPKHSHTTPSKLKSKHSSPHTLTMPPTLTTPNGTSIPQASPGIELREPPQGSRVEKCKAYMDTISRLSRGPEASAAMKELIQKPVVRLAETRVDIRLNTERKTAIEAGLVQCRGEIALTGCEYCMNGSGPFPHCVTLQGYLNGACANCHYYSTGSRCSFRQNQTTPGTEIKKMVSGDTRRKSGTGSPPPPASSRKRKRPTTETLVDPETRLLETLAALQAQTSKVRAASTPRNTTKAPKSKGLGNASVKKLRGRHRILMAASMAAKDASVSAKETAKALKKAAKAQQSFAASCSHLAGLLADEAGLDKHDNQDETSTSSDGSETGYASDQ